jgi:hypothetical protein
MLAISGILGVKSSSLNPVGAKVHAPEPEKAYSPRMSIFHQESWAEAVDTAINIAIAATLTNTANFLILTFI